MHRLIAGITGCGKGVLLKRTIIPMWRRKGHAVMVCDPNCASDWGADYLTDDPLKLMERAKRSQSCILVVDECDESLRGSALLERKLKYLATRCRNDGHLTYFVAQRVMQVPPSYRGQCSQFFGFKQAPADVEELINLSARPDFIECLKLPDSGECLHYRPGIPRLQRLLVRIPGR